MARSDLLNGEDRVEHSKTLGRVIRQGSLSEMNVADQERVHAALKNKDQKSALAYIELVYPQYLSMSTTLLEWSIAFPVALSQKVGSAKAKPITEAAYNQWKDIVESEKETSEKVEAGKVLLDLLRPGNENRIADRESISQKMNLAPAESCAKLIQSVSEGHFDSAVAAFDHCILETRGRHDFLCQYLWVYPTAIQEALGQSLSEEVLLSSFQTCSFYEPIFDLTERVPVEELVVILAEHLRAHFSGNGRKSAVEVVEEPDRFRLIFASCGSGGAMRVKAGQTPSPGLGTYPEATPSTWGLANQVPSYCAHCAQNEIAMAKRAGYPRWVTEFNPNPNQPCGWTVYKDPSMIPEKYFTRIGLKKGPKGN